VDGEEIRVLLRINAIISIPGLERWLSGRKRPPAKWVTGLFLFSGSNPDLSARTFASSTRLPKEALPTDHGILAMRMRRFFLPLTLLAACCAHGQSLQQYLSLRKQYKITQAVGVPALETLVGSRIVEVQGTVKGVFKVQDKSALMLERTDGGTEIVDANGVPDWLLGNEIPARLIVRATRAHETAQLKCNLIAAAPESKIKEIENVEAEKAAARRRLEASKASRGTPANRNTNSVGNPLYGPIGKGKSGKTWNLPANDVTPIYAGFIKGRNPRLSDAEAYRIAQGVVGFSLQYGVDARLIMAMVLVESGFNPSARSYAGAMGLGQLMPGTAAGMGIGNPYDSIQNLYGCVRIVRGHLDKYNKQTGDGFKGLILALAAYNAGSGSVRKYGGVPPYKQTERYIEKVIGWYKALTGSQ
jgi:soluble lytic murein transglycosylase-like protein